MLPPYDLESRIAHFETTHLPPVVELMTSDEDNDLIVFRKFKDLNLFSLLYQQNHLNALDRKVKDCRGKDAEKLNELLPEVCYTALLQLEQLLKLAEPAERIKDYLVDESDNGQSELKCLTNRIAREDLVSLVSRPKGLIHRWIDQNPRLRYPFLKPRTETQPEHLQLYAEKHVRRAEKALINLTFVILVLVPIGVLPYLSSTQTKLAVIIGATVMAAILAAGVLEDYSRSSLGLMVGYTAILVVFLGNSI